MKIQLGITKEWTIVERRKLKVVDLREFLMQHYPRDHGWADEKEALLFLQDHLSTEYLHTVLKAMKDDTNEVTREAPELIHKKFWFEMVGDGK
ncbi:MAG TPA: hypothetical protein VD838_08445 [Anaeromyxobacteraceae bacterium]|nr:hypothetical protein [Anaeromyxobacteraceae bacterium]